MESPKSPHQVCSFRSETDLSRRPSKPRAGARHANGAANRFAGEPHCQEARQTFHRRAWQRLIHYDRDVLVVRIPRIGRPALRPRVLAFADDPLAHKLHHLVGRSR